MADFCDWSPCARLLQALGRYVFGDPKTGEYKMLVRIHGHRGSVPVTITYCPFCGTRMDNLELATTGQIIVVPNPPKKLKKGDG